MIVFGATDCAGALVRLGKFLGYHVTVCDARPVCATRIRFPDANDIAFERPHECLAPRPTSTRGPSCAC
ncbi:XdhC family protein [Georgenia sp. Z1491]|uniref:XdhC family protein n=1 Tax=Georgenia sp. Z1491 TaxID=3416707 RepID=UPI003CEEA454